jgi:hypothetical protein
VRFFLSRLRMSICFHMCPCMYSLLLHKRKFLPVKKKNTTLSPLTIPSPTAAGWPELRSSRWWRPVTGQRDRVLLLAAGFTDGGGALGSGGARGGGGRRRGKAGAMRILAAVVSRRRDSPTEAGRWGFEELAVVAAGAGATPALG